MQEQPPETTTPVDDRANNPVAKTDKAINPFYPLLVLGGTLFLITACAYAVMAYRSLKMNIHGEGGLMQMMRVHGSTIFTIELSVLAVLLIAAMATDRFWQRRLSRRR